ncbi:ATP-binding protein [Paucibacter sp. APW11]|uniref:histidine kinase n=1 Tax=Roseateles aquae TaxID=3077235 RepID=A0ABU3PEX6_9BURK|nr:ATP-binding protein [Paucibacter sp. APW11]MDT9000658.1 ATP-binding protein [Paucibacter sp. APW11]
MNRLLWRLLPLTLAALLLASALVYLVFARLYGDPLEDIARKQAAGQIFLLEQYIDQAPGDEWLARLNKVREVSAQRYELLPLAQVLPTLDERRQEALQTGALVLDIGAKALLRRVDIRGLRYVDSEAEVLRISGLPIDVADVWRREALRLLLVALVLLLPLVWWSRAHWRGLLALSQTVQDWAAGRLHARAVRPVSASLQPLAEGMNQMAARLQGLLDGRRDLLHAVSHELRTPIARLGFGLALLREAPSAEQRDARLAAMEGDLDELQALVTELLGYSRLEQTPLQLADVDLQTLLQQAAATWPVPPAAAALDLAIDASLGSARADARQLARLLDNLLSNARKYAVQQVRLSAAPLPSGGWRLRVEDDGPGIPAADAQRVFEPFVRLQRDVDASLAGHGLGLAIVARIVAAHGGQLRLEASRLGGACFVAEWPAEPPLVVH